MRLGGFLLLFVALHVDAQSWDWTQTISQGGNNYTWDVATDSQNNTISTGRVKFQVKFGSGSSFLISDGFGLQTDVFLMKLDTAGTLIWARRMGDVYPDWGRSVAVDNDDNIYIAGEFVNMAVFGSDTIYGYDNGSTNPNTQARSGFIAKYSSSGDLIWVNKFQGGDRCKAYGIDVDSNGNAYITGVIMGLTQFDSHVTGENNTKQFGFVAKYDASGVCSWVYYIQSPFGSLGNAIKVINDEHIAVTGSYKNQMTFDGQSFPGGSTTWGNYFLAKIDSAGSLIWNKTGIGSFDIAGTNLTNDDQENIYAVGYFGYAVNFGTVSFTSMGVGSTTTEINNHHDVFLAKYSQEGTLLWVKHLGNQTVSHFDGIDLMDNNHILIAGYANDSIYLSDPSDTVIVNNTLVTSVIIAFDSLGNNLWHKEIIPVGTSPENAMIAVTSDNYYNIYCAGFFDETGHLDNHIISASGGYDAYISKIFPPLEPTLDGNTMACENDTLLLAGSNYGYPYTYNWDIGGLNLLSQTDDSLYVIALSPGSDTIRYIVSNAYETDTVVYIVTVNEIPIIDLGSDELICEGQSLDLDAGTSGYSYNWGSGFVPDDTAMTVMTAGTYTVQIIDSNGCIGSDYMVLTVSDCLDLPEEGVVSWTVSPNPFSSYLKPVFAANTFSSGSYPYRFVIYSLTGEKVFVSDNITSGEIIDLSQLNSGVYFCEISSGEEKTNLFKVVKID